MTRVAICKDSLGSCSRGGGWSEGRGTWYNLSPGTSLMNVEALALFIQVGVGAGRLEKGFPFLVGIFVWCPGLHGFETPLRLGSKPKLQRPGHSRLHTLPTTLKFSSAHFRVGCEENSLFLELCLLTGEDAHTKEAFPTSTGLSSSTVLIPCPCNTNPDTLEMNS